MRTLAIAVALVFVACSKLFGGNPVQVPIAKAKVEYPLYARQHGITGSGIYVLHVDRATGNVTSVEVAKSAGSAILDNAAIKAFSQFKFKPGATARIRVPAKWSLPGR